jgi:hypothetical protein
MRMLKARSKMRKSKNKAYIYVPMAIVLDEQFPFETHTDPEMVEVEISIQKGGLTIKQINKAIRDDASLLYD